MSLSNEFQAGRASLAPARRTRTSCVAGLLSTAGLALALLGSPAWAATGPFDHVFQGLRRPEAKSPGGESWSFGEYSALRLAPSEAGLVPVGGPAQLSAEQLQGWLAGVKSLGTQSKGELLFDRDELEALTPVLSQALAAAQPAQDVLLLSAARRGVGVLVPQMAITGRFFVAEGALQLIVQADRSDAVPAWRNTHVLPLLGFGSRAAASPGIKLAAPGATQVRSDWLAWSLVAKPVPAAAVAAPVAAQPAVQPVAPPPPVVDANTSAEEIGRRLQRLKVLREQGHITEAEYRDQRERILRGL